MGKSQSKTRSFTINNEKPIFYVNPDIIQISDDIVQRLKTTNISQLPEQEQLTLNKYKDNNGSINISKDVFDRLQNKNIDSSTTPAPTITVATTPNCSPEDYTSVAAPWLALGCTNKPYFYEPSSVASQIHKRFLTLYKESTANCIELPEHTVQEVKTIERNSQLTMAEIKAEIKKLNKRVSALQKIRMHEVMESEYQKAIDEHGRDHYKTLPVESTKWCKEVIAFAECVDVQRALV